jgi:hypothetical protein
VILVDKSGSVKKIILIGVIVIIILVVSLFALRWYFNRNQPGFGPINITRPSAERPIVVDDPIIMLQRGRELRIGYYNNDDRNHYDVEGQFGKCVDLDRGIEVNNIVSIISFKNDVPALEVIVVMSFVKPTNLSVVGRYICRLDVVGYNQPVSPNSVRNLQDPKDPLTVFASKDIGIEIVHKP